MSKTCTARYVYPSSVVIGWNRVSSLGWGLSLLLTHSAPCHVKQIRVLRLNAVENIRVTKYSAIDYKVTLIVEFSKDGGIVPPSNCSMHCALVRTRSLFSIVLYIRHIITR